MFEAGSSKQSDLVCCTHKDRIICCLSEIYFFLCPGFCCVCMAFAMASSAAAANNTGRLGSSNLSNLTVQWWHKQFSDIYDRAELWLHSPDAESYRDKWMCDESQYFRMMSFQGGHKNRPSVTIDVECDCVDGTLKKASKPEQPRTKPTLKTRTVTGWKWEQYANRKRSLSVLREMMDFVTVEGSSSVCHWNPQIYAIKRITVHYVIYHNNDDLQHTFSARGEAQLTHAERYFMLRGETIKRSAFRRHVKMLRHTQDACNVLHLQWHLKAPDGKVIRLPTVLTLYILTFLAPVDQIQAHVSILHREQLSIRHQ